MRNLACGECVVSAFLEAPATPDISPETQRALHLLSESGMSPPLRFIEASSG